MPIHPDEIARYGGDVQTACHRMIEKTIERMYADSDENRFLEVTYASGDKEILYFKDFNSGAMIENIVRRAKKDAIKRFLSTGEKGIKSEDLFHAIRDEFKENEDLPNTTNPDDWARISGKKGERIVYVRTLLGPRATAARSSGSARASTCSRTPGYSAVMAIPKVMGTETEYGIAAAGAPDFNPVLSSSMLISSYAGSLRKIRWDYEDESPMRDARGFEPQPGREMSDEDLGLANVILPNGARYYVDHAHPEYSTPECLTPRDLVVHDKAGERILERSLRGRRGRHAAGTAAVGLQEQLRRQGQLLRHARELSGGPGDAVRRHRSRPHAVLREPPDLHRRRQGRATKGTGTTAPPAATS